MENVLNVSPGLMIWTLINFFLLLVLLIKFGVKPILNGIRSREAGIRDEINNATKANLEAQSLLLESQNKLQTVQKEMGEIIHKARVQAEELIHKASEEAERLKRQKVDEATKEIERSKESAILALRSEVAGLVVIATEKLLGETLDKEKHIKLVELHIEKLPKN